MDPLANHTSSDAVQCLPPCSPCEHTDHRGPHIHVYSASHKPPCSDPEKPPHARSPHVCSPSKALLPCTRTRPQRRAHAHGASEACTHTRGLRGKHTYMGASEAYTCLIPQALTHLLRPTHLAQNQRHRCVQILACLKITLVVTTNKLSTPWFNI